MKFFEKSVNNENYIFYACKNIFAYPYLMKHEIISKYQYIKKKSGVVLTQLSLTLHNSRRIFYYQHYINI